MGSSKKKNAFYAVVLPGRAGAVTMLELYERRVGIRGHGPESERLVGDLAPRVERVHWVDPEEPEGEEQRQEGGRARAEGQLEEDAEEPGLELVAEDVGQRGVGAVR